MKARIRKTGEIVDVEPDNGNVYYNQKDGETYRPDEIDLECCNSPVDWEQRRYEIAKELYPKLLFTSLEGRSLAAEADAESAAELADILIVELKKGDGK